ncbi:putative phosphoribosyltransferase [Cylindrospermum stagnale PCC 7417]|uniref:Putative phosphoribosyltransferase n=1 Tax=Cylindrospermum stagnale PCC 7417 TaxID=56107 RepID=K9WVD7_9NOST|nr:phosphoribosyltransferase [Cylindrospermum stagnale]AFZ23779.1 putative phosphoribosyltransferase [Cylindrospermum stagnale PCC 7417]
MLFQDRRLAGQFLAGELAAYANRSDVVVLGLPRGGVPVAFEVARAINAPLGVLVVRKLGVPGQKELAMGAIAPGGVRVLNEQIISEENIPDEAIATMALQEQRELERRERLYQGNRPSLDLQERTVILVDDGLATGATMLAAIVAVRKQQPAKIVVAVPVAAPPTYEDLAGLVDEIACISQPNPFYSVGLWYEQFPQITDDEVCDLLAKAANNGQKLSLGT